MRFISLASLAVSALAIWSASATAQQRPAQPSATSRSSEAVARFMGAAAAPTPSGTRVNINRAPLGEFDAVLQLEDAHAYSIVAGRPYASVQDLLVRQILPQSAYDAVKDRLTVH